MRYRTQEFGDEAVALYKEADEDNEHDSTIEVLGLATYSNSDSTVLSYASIFETLWIQAELKHKKRVGSIS